MQLEENGFVLAQSSGHSPPQKESHRTEEPEALRHTSLCETPFPGDATRCHPQTKVNKSPYILCRSRGWLSRKGSTIPLRRCAPKEGAVCVAGKPGHAPAPVLATTYAHPGKPQRIPRTASQQSREQSEADPETKEAKRKRRTAGPPTTLPLKSTTTRKGCPGHLRA